MWVLAGLIAFNVCIQLACALLLKFAPEPGPGNYITIGLMISAVLALNATLFASWGIIHKRFPISLAYPASAAFLPALLAMAWWLGESIRSEQFLGAGLVIAGIVLLFSEPAARP